MKLGFTIGFHPDELEILYGGNFGHTTLRNYFLVLDLDECYNNSSLAFISYFVGDLKFVKWHIRLGHSV